MSDEKCKMEFIKVGDYVVRLDAIQYVNFFPTQVTVVTKKDQNLRTNEPNEMAGLRDFFSKCSVGMSTSPFAKSFQSPTPTTD